jgi:AcrR family transcriptional regulator
VTAKGTRQRGRPRNGAADAAIADAAAQLMTERGYRGMTVAAVADAAGVSEPTVYLRYPTKNDLALAAIAQLPVLADPLDTGDARSDLGHFLQEMAGTAQQIGLSHVGVVLVEEVDHPELLRRWRAVAGRALNDAVRTIIERGQARQQVSADVDVGVLADVLLGAYLGRYLNGGRPDRRWTVKVVDLVWASIASPT